MELEALMKRMDFSGLQTINLTHNDLAKDHLRHLVSILLDKFIAILIVSEIDSVIKMF